LLGLAGRLPGLGQEEVEQAIAHEFGVLGRTGLVGLVLEDGLVGLERCPPSGDRLVEVRLKRFDPQLVLRIAPLEAGEIGQGGVPEGFHPIEGHQGVLPAPRRVGGHAGVVLEMGARGSAFGLRRQQVGHGLGGALGQLCLEPGDVEWAILGVGLCRQQG